MGARETQSPDATFIRVSRFISLSKKGFRESTKQGIGGRLTQSENTNSRDERKLLERKMPCLRVWIISMEKLRRRGGLFMS